MSDFDQKWPQAILSIDSSIKQAAQILNETSLKIVLITDEFGILVGIISDGDIRRGLLSGLALNSSVESIIQKKALVVPPDFSREVVIKLMLANKIQQVPIVDENKRVVGLHLWDQISAPIPRTNIMVIMAGGKGTRLLPQTANCPKPLLPLAGKPILEHIIDRAKAQGFSHFIIAIHHLGQMIEDYFGNGDTFGVRIEYLREEMPLGTAGALSLLNPIPDFDFVVTNGDVLTDIQYGELLDFHSKHGATGTMAVYTHELQNPFGVVQTRGIDITDYEEKPIFRNLVNAGVYSFKPSAIRLIKNSVSCDMPTLFELIRQENLRTIAYPIHESWLDIGGPSQLTEANVKINFENNKNL